MAATIWRGRIVFDLVSIPVRLYKAARREPIQFHNVYPIGNVAAAAASSPGRSDSSGPESNLRQFPGPSRAAEGAPLPDRVGRVHLAFVGQDPNVPLSKDTLLKGYEVEPERYVILTSSEVAALRARASANLDISEFVDAGEIDRTYLDSSYYLAPDHDAEKAYSLFYRVLAETGSAAIGEWVRGGREHAVCIRPGSRGLVLHTLYYEPEVRVEEESPADLGAVDEKALELAKILVEAKRGKFDLSKFKDKYKERVLEVIQSRTHTAVLGDAPEPTRKTVPILDTMDALRKSVEALRKPPQQEGDGPSPKKKDGRRAK